jgi:hypothetical protein
MCAGDKYSSFMGHSGNYNEKGFMALVPVEEEPNGVACEEKPAWGQCYKTFFSLSLMLCIVYLASLWKLVECLWVRLRLHMHNLDKACIGVEVN